MWQRISIHIQKALHNRYIKMDENTIMDSVVQVSIFNEDNSTFEGQFLPKFVLPSTFIRYCFKM